VAKIGADGFTQEGFSASTMGIGRGSHCNPNLIWFGQIGSPGTGESLEKLSRPDPSF
jgi:hypothetical protein